MKNTKIGWKTYLVAAWVSLFILIPVAAFLYESGLSGGLISVIFERDIELKEVVTNDSVTIEDATIEITDCGVCTQWDDMAPEGFSVIYVSYEMEGETYYNIPVYLKLAEGEYIVNMDKEQLNLAFGETEEELDTVYKISNNLEEGYGNLVYLVPDDATEIQLAIYPVINQNGTKAMGEVFLVPVDCEVE